jgi:periplasmic protein TonB
MSNAALAYSYARADVRRSRLLRQRVLRPVRELRPWSEVAVAGLPLQSASGHPPHIGPKQLTALIVTAIALHLGAGAYLLQHETQRPVKPVRQELNIELVRPPKPVEPPKPEPPKAQPPKPQPQTQALPPIQQQVFEPTPEPAATEAVVAVAPVAPPEPPPPPPVTEPIGRAGYLNNPAPDYPPQAARQGWQGTVVLRVHVQPDGTASQIEVKQSSGRRVLDEAAIATVKKWMFTPAKRGETPIDGWATVPIEFLLDQ